MITESLLLQRVPGTAHSLKKNAKEVKIAIFFIQYFPTSETAMLFERFAGIRAMMKRGKPEVQGEKPVGLPRCTPHMN